MSKTKKYTWEIDDNVEIWRHDLFDTEEECVGDYLGNYARERPEESIFVGEVEPYSISVDSSSVIEGLEEQAYDECGECSENWEPSAIKGEENWNELDEQLTKVVVDWLTKHNEMPSFYNIINVREVAVR